MNKPEFIEVGEEAIVIICTLDKPQEYYQSFLKLNKKDLERFKDLKPKRRLEWLGVRYTIRAYLKDEKFTITHNTDGKPGFKNLKKQLSISHSKNKIACYISDQECGVDIQFFTDKIFRVSEKFINDQEQKSLIKNQLIEQLHVIWSAKEAIYKRYSKRGISLKDNISIEPFEIKGTEFEIRGNLSVNEETFKYRLGVYLSKKDVLVWTLD